MNVALCRDDASYPAAGTLSANWSVRRVSQDRLQGIELSVLWLTDGKGDEDLHVHHFERLDAADIANLNVSLPQSLSCRLPPTPLSYHGRLVSVRWCLRVRLFMTDGKEIVTESPFHLVSPEPNPSETRRPEFIDEPNPVASSPAMKTRETLETPKTLEVEVNAAAGGGRKSERDADSVLFQRIRRPKTFLRATDRL
ncbi:MAG: hypothetical protein AAF989_03450 [Planctomycetota bacterium]